MQENSEFWADWELIAPIPSTILNPDGGPRNPPPPPKFEEPVGYDDVQTFAYRDTAGGVLGCIIRFERRDGKGKEPRPLTYWRNSKGKERWFWKGWPAPRPLYGLDRIAAKPRAPVLVLEGEKCADAAAKSLPGYAAISWPFGANSTAVSKVDWNPLDRPGTDCEVFLWPDNDLAGFDAALEIARRLSGRDVKIVKPDAGWRQGHDIADLIEEGWDAERLEAFIRDQSVPPPEFVDYLREREVAAARAVLAGVLAKLETDPAAHLSDEAVAAASRLKELDIAEYGRYESELKKRRCNLTLLREAIGRRKRIEKAENQAAEQMKSSEAAQPEVKESQAAALVNLARSEVAELFHDGDSAFALVIVKSEGAQHREVWSLHSRGFGQWLARLFFEAKDKAASGEALSAALNTLAGFARFGTGEDAAIEHRVNVRVAESRSKIYIDLCDSAWRVIEIDADGWRLIENPSERGVYFRRARAMKPLPIPESGGSLADLRRFVNFASDHDFILIVAWLIGALHPRGPYPILGLNGEHGSAKTSASRYLRGTIDPNISVARAAPKKEEDILIAASNSWVVSFDNLSYISQQLSDALCRLSTGGGLSKRELYTDGEEYILDAKRPQIFNSIEEVATAGDLVDRLMISTLNQIEDSGRREESELDREFDEARPKILGALLNAVSTALRNRDGVKIQRLPRMADFARWVVAAEPACPWKPGEFLRAYMQNREEANVSTLESSIIYGPLVALGDFEGTSTALLEALTAKLPDDKRPPAARLPKDWPANARAMSGALRRIAPAIRRVGINVVFPPREPGKKRTRILKIEHSRPEEPGKFASEPSEPSGSEQDGQQTQERRPGDSGRKPDANDLEPDEFASDEKPKKNNGISTSPQRSDAADAKIQDFSDDGEDILEPDEERI